MDPLARMAWMEGLLRPKTTVTKTTLFRLFEAIQKEVLPGEDALVVAVVSHLMRTGRIRVPFSREEGEDYSNAAIFGT